MERNASGSLDRTRAVFENQRTVWIVAAISLFLFLIGNLPWQLDDYDQAKQAFTSFQMVREGRWLYQQTPHDRVATKPPLVAWASAGFFAISRSWEVAWRLPSLLAAAALALVLFRSARSGYGIPAGTIALAAFGLNLLSVRLATLVRTDMPLALLVFLIGLLVWQKIRTERAWTRRDRVYLFLLLTAAMLIKGPIVYAFLLPGIAVTRAVALRATRALPTDTQLKNVWGGWWPWLVSLAVFLVWVIGGIWYQPGFYDEVVMREFVGRFGETIHRPQPVYFYLLHLLHKFAPWSIVMIAIAIAALQARKWRFRIVLLELSPETFWLLCWSIGGLIAMSLIPSKRVDRIFPIVPPLCLLLAAQISDAALPRKASHSGDARRLSLWAGVAVVAAVLFTVGYTVDKVVTGYRDHRNALAIFGRKVLDELQAHHWRYEVVSAKDEGLLLYLQKTHFVSPDEAVTDWNNGTVDALIASTEKAQALMSQLAGASLSEFRSTETNGRQGNSYVLMTR